MLDAENRRVGLLVGVACVIAACQAKESEKAPEPSAPAALAQPAPSAPQKAPEPTLAELNAFKPPTAKGKVSFKNLKDGAKISGKAFMGAVAVELELEAVGMRVEPAAAVHENAGHFALGIDAEPVPLGCAVKKGYQVYEKGETKVQAGVRPGEHTLTVQLVDARNRSYGPEWAQSIKVKVAAK
jgi:hypothetical protein